VIRGKKKYLNFSFKRGEESPWLILQAEERERKNSDRGGVRQTQVLCKGEKRKQGISAGSKKGI